MNHFILKYGSLYHAFTTQNMFLLRKTHNHNATFTGYGQHLLCLKRLRITADLSLGTSCCHCIACHRMQMYPCDIKKDNILRGSLSLDNLTEKIICVESIQSQEFLWCNFPIMSES